MGDVWRVRLRGCERDFFYPVGGDWVGFCQTLDEAFNPKNWHYFTNVPMELRADDVVVDCGAAEGLFSFLAAPNVRRVYAVEPMPGWLPSLKKSLEPFANAEICACGVSNRKAQLRMSDHGIASQICSYGEIAIEVETLDSLFFEKGIDVSYIKADVEGFEFPMLLGGEELIRKCRPRISITVYHGENHFLEMQGYLKNLHPDYQFRVVGMAETGNPVLLQAW